MIVVAIIGILAAIAIPKFAELIRKSNEGATRGNLGALRSALSIYYGDMEGQYPDRLDSLTIAAKYIQALPYSNTNPYHKAYNVETRSATQPGVPYGNWWYNNVSGDANYGFVWVNCTHTDSRGSVWTTY